MPSRRKPFYFLLLPCLLFASLLSACQMGPTDQVQTCNPKSRPTIKTLQPTQATSQTIYATSGPNLYALNAGNGAMHWCSKISAGNERDDIASVTRNGDMLYTFTEQGAITAFTAHSGALVWSTNTGNIYSDLDSEAISPSMNNNTIYGGTRSIFALNTADGSVRWQYTLPDNFFANAVPQVSGGKVYVGAHFSPLNQPDNQPDQLIALDATTGKKLWTFSLHQRRLHDDLTVGDGIVVLQYEGTASDGAMAEGLIAVDTQSGKLLWQKDLDTFTWMSISNGLLYVSAAIPSNRIDAIQGLYAFDIHTGTVRWSLTQNSAPLDIDEPFIVSQNTLYTANGDGKISAINALTGQLFWHTQLALASVRTRPVRLILLGQKLFIGVEDFSFYPKSIRYFLHALNISTREESWFADITSIELPNITGIDLGA